jgi:hypothetical protein
MKTHSTPRVRSVLWRTAAASTIDTHVRPATYAAAMGGCQRFPSPYYDYWS